MGIKEDLYEQYDDILFKSLMLEVAKEEGRRLIRENKRLKGDPSFEVPAEIYRHGLKTIRKTFKQRESGARARKAGRLIYRIAVLLLAVILLATVAFAAFPDLRARIVNIFLHEYETHTDLVFQGDGPYDKEHIIRVDWLPEGFKLEESGETYDAAWEKWSDNTKRAVILSRSEPVTQSFDTEDAEVSSITIQDYQGTMIIEDDMIQIVWFNFDNNNVYSIVALDLTESEAIKVAQNFF